MYRWKSSRRIVEEWSEIREKHYRDTYNELRERLVKELEEIRIYNSGLDIKLIREEILRKGLEGYRGRYVLDNKEDKQSSVVWREREWGKARRSLRKQYEKQESEAFGMKEFM